MLMVVAGYMQSMSIMPSVFRKPREDVFADIDDSEASVQAWLRHTYKQCRDVIAAPIAPNCTKGLTLLHPATFHRNMANPCQACAKEAILVAFHKRNETENRN